MTDISREAIVSAYAQRGARAFTPESYSREGMLDALRELRSRYAHDEGVKRLGQLAETLANDLASIVDVPLRDIATVLMVAGGAAGVLADFHGMPGESIAAVLQYAADDLDQRANGGE